VNALKLPPQSRPAFTAPPTVLKIPESVNKAVRPAILAARDYLMGSRQPSSGSGNWSGYDAESDYICWSEHGEIETHSLS